MGIRVHSMNARRPPPWESTPGGSGPADTSPRAGRPRAWAERSATAQATARPSGPRRPCSTPPSRSLGEPPPSSPTLQSPPRRSPSALPPGSPPAGSRVLLGVAVSGFLLSRSACRPAPPFLRPDRLPLPAGARPAALSGHHRLRVLRSSRTSAGPSTIVLSSSGLPATIARTQQTSRGEMLRSRRDRVATTPSVLTGIGHRGPGPTRPPRTPYGASLLVRDDGRATSRPQKPATSQPSSGPFSTGPSGLVFDRP